MNAFVTQVLADASTALPAVVSWGGPGHGGPDWDGPGGWGFGPGPFFLLFPLLLGLAAAAAIVIWRRRSSDTSSSEATLEDRFARGDLSEEEYRSRLAVIREMRG